MGEIDEFGLTGNEPWFKHYLAYMEELIKRYDVKFIPNVEYGMRYWNEPSPIGGGYMTMCTAWRETRGLLEKDYCMFKLGHEGPHSFELTDQQKTSQLLNMPYLETKSPALEAQDVVNDRMDKYGPPVEHFKQVAAMWSAYIDAPITAEDVCHMMAMMKQTREKFSHNRDNEVDAHGYLICAELCAAAERGEI